MRNAYGCPNQFGLNFEQNGSNNKGVLIKLSGNLCMNVHRRMVLLQLTQKWLLWISITDPKAYSCLVNILIDNPEKLPTVQVPVSHSSRCKNEFISLKFISLV